MYAGTRVIPSLSARFKMQQASLEKIEMLYHLDYIILSSSIVQMYGNHITRQLKGHFVKLEHDNLEFLQDNIYLVHRTRPGTTTGGRNSRTMNIRGPMMGHSIGSDNHIRKRKLQGDEA